jgi:RNA polymerase sigma factor (sigma-70 family)
VRKRDWDKYYPRYLPAIKGIARKLSHNDDQLAEDLEQEGALALWLLTPGNATNNESAWVRMAIRNRMIDFLRKYNPQVYESLDARLDAGDQLEQLEATGELKLFTSRVPGPKLLDETEWEALEENDE